MPIGFIPGLRQLLHHKVPIGDCGLIGQIWIDIFLMDAGFSR
jgi:hypothetical protein